MLHKRKLVGVLVYLGVGVCVFVCMYRLLHMPCVLLSSRIRPVTPRSSDSRREAALLVFAVVSSEEI